MDTLVDAPRVPSSPPLAFLQGKRFWFAPLAALLFWGVYLGILYASSGNLVNRQITSEVGQILSLSSLVTLCWWASKRATTERVRWAWRLFALATLTYTIAEITFGFESIVIFHQNTPTPTIADAFYLPFYGLMTASLLLLPAEERRQNARLRSIVDAGIIVGAFLGLALVYLIGPNFSSTDSPFTIGVLIAYPVGDILLILTLILLLTRGTQIAFRPVLFWVTVGLIAFIYADVAFDYFGLQGSYTVGSLIVDPFWALGELMISMAPLYYIVNGEKLATPFLWLSQINKATLGESLLGAVQRIVLPLLSVLVLALLLILNTPAIPMNSYFPILAILGGFVIVLITLRQILIGRDLVDAQTSFQRAQQLDGLKNQFITSVNHELRTPLMTMQAYVEVLRIRQAELSGERRTQIITEIGRTSDALVDLVQSILEVRRLDQETNDFPREAIAVSSAIEQSLALINPREANVQSSTIQTRIPPGFAIWGDAVRFQQIMTNLLSNAIKYSPEGGAIQVEAHFIDTPKSLRSRRGKQQMAEITVRDHGLGIPPEQIPLLFQQFVRLPRDLASNIVGSGIGLYLSRSLVEAMDGIIWVESRGIEGEGSTFHVVLPLAPTDIALSDTETLPRLRAIKRA